MNGSAVVVDGAAGRSSHAPKIECAQQSFSDLLISLNDDRYFGRSGLLRHGEYDDEEKNVESERTTGLLFKKDFDGFPKEDALKYKGMYQAFLTALHSFFTGPEGYGRALEKSELNVLAKMMFDASLEIRDVMTVCKVRKESVEKLRGVIRMGVPLRRFYRGFIGKQKATAAPLDFNVPEMLEKYREYSSTYKNSAFGFNSKNSNKTYSKVVTITDETEYDVIWLRSLIGAKYKNLEERKVIFEAVVHCIAEAFHVESAAKMVIESVKISSMQTPLYDVLGNFELVAEIVKHIDTVVKSLGTLYKTHAAKVRRHEASGESVSSSGGGTFKVRRIHAQDAPRANIMDTFVASLWTATRPERGRPLGYGQAHLMEGVTRLDVGLPSNATTQESLERTTVTIPPRDILHVAEDELLPISTAFSQMGKVVFGRYERLNKVQSDLYDTAYRRNDSFLLCSPTGSGKTDVAMMAVLREIEKGGTDVGNGRIIPAAASEFKIVYVCPMKALAAEMTNNFTRRLKGVGIVVREMTGDTRLTKSQLNETHVLVTTPEKWDVVTRSSIDAASLCRLLIVDEVHLLNDERGPVIEAIVARTKRQVQRSQALIRIVGLSATLPNYLEIAEFLGVARKNVFRFGDECRPVPLKMRFIGVKGIKDSREMRTKMGNACFDEVYEVLKNGHQVLVFVHSRKSTYMTANEIIRGLAKAKVDRLEPGRSGRLRKRTAKSRNGELVDIVVNNGIGFHHAGMLRSDRTMVEDLFREGEIRVLCCTATLAWGVNLPARAVIIKGTEYYNPSRGGFVELDILDVLQIFGRAGRPQYDTLGEATIITEHVSLQHYLRFLTHQLPIDSHLPARLPDMLNAEIALGTISSVEDAVEWLSYTFLYIRMKGGKAELHDMVTEAASSLDSARMVRYDRRRGTLSPTAFGRIASSFYVSMESVVIFNEELFHRERLFEKDGTKDHIGEDTILRGEEASDHVLAREGAAMRILSISHEFAQLQVREEEEKELESVSSQVNKNFLHVEGPMETVPSKVATLAGALISRYRLSEFSLVCDSNYVLQNGPRIARALFEMALSERWSAAAFEFIQLSQALDRKWWAFRNPLGLFPKIPPTIVERVEAARLSIDDMVHMSADDIGYSIRHTGYGPMLAKYASFFPRVSVEASIKTITRVIAKVEVKITCEFNWADHIHGKNAIAFWLWLVDESSETRDDILHSEHILIRKKERFDPRAVSFHVYLASLGQRLVVYTIADHWPGSINLEPLPTQDLYLPLSSTLHTELLPLVPLPVLALQNPMYMRCYGFEYFNPVQTQCFHTAYHDDANVLVGAPTGSGKTAIAEFCMLRVLNTHERKRIVYIAPLKALVRERTRDWRSRFGSVLKLKVTELTGDTTMADMASIRSSDVICTTPEKWDSISRKWESRDYVKDVALVIFDEVHLLGTERGPILEVILARLGDISKAVEEPIRVVALSTACSNAGDLADWLSVPQRGEFNFRPNVRPVPLEPHISGFSGKHYCPRMALMNKPAFEAINQFSPSKPVLIFVSSRRQTRLTAFDLVRFVSERPEYAPLDGDSVRGFGIRRFLSAGIGETKLEDICSAAKDSSLRYTLAFGIGIHHAGLSDSDRILVETLFRDGTIQVLVATSTLAWGVNLPAHLVIVKGTEYYDAESGRYVDIPVTDVLQMIGRAGRPQFDTKGYVCLYTAEDKKEFYRRFLYEPFPVESSLASSMTDHISAEISFGHIGNEVDALMFLGTTFLARRAGTNPTYYGITRQGSLDSVELYVQTLVKESLEVLIERGCIKADGESKMVSMEGREELYQVRELRSTPLGDIAAFYYVSTKTMHIFSRRARELKTQRTQRNGNTIVAFEDILRLLCDASEFDGLPVRHNEDMLNVDLMKKVRVKVSINDVASPHAKAFLLLQAAFDAIPLPISDYKTDLKSVCDQIIRITQTLIDIFVQTMGDSPGGVLLDVLRIVNVLQMIIQFHWITDSPILVVPGVDVSLKERLESVGLGQLPVLVKRVDEFERILKKSQRPTMVRTAVEYVKMLPVLDMKVNCVSEKVECTFTRKSSANAGRFVIAKFPKATSESWFAVVGDDKGKIYHFTRFTIGRTKTLEFPLKKEPQRKYTFYCMSECYVGMDRVFDF